MTRTNREVDLSRPGRVSSGARARRLFGSVPVLILVGVAVLTPNATYAVSTFCSPVYKQWSVTTTATPAIASLPVPDTSFSPVPGRSRTYFTQGTELFTIYNQNYPPGCNGVAGPGGLCAPNGSGNTCTRLKGCRLATWIASPSSTLSSSPNVVPVSNDLTKEYIFLGADNGRLYRLDVTGDPPYPTISIDTRRPSCASDKVIATPGVQLYAYSDSVFRTGVDSYGPAHAQDDVVFVVTSTGCGDLTHNRIIAYWASDLSIKWVFNAPRLLGEEVGPVRMGSGTEGCTLDYGSNRLYCGTDLPPGADQDSLWALSTINGQLVWSDNPGGAVLNRPVLNPNNNRLYVVSRPGALWAYSPAGNGLGGPSKLWTAGLSVASPGALVVRSPSVESRAGTWQNKILSLDSSGKLFAVQDNGTSGSLLWAIRPTDAARWVSTPVVLPGATESKAFIGRDDGYLQMVKLDGGQPQGVIQIASSTSQDVYDPAIDSDPLGDAVVVVGGTQVARIRVPICVDDPGPGASNCFDECFLPGEADGYPTPNWNPFCVSPDHSCWSYSCRNPANNPQYNPCHSLASPTSACLNNDYPECFLGGTGCTFQGDVPDGMACDDGWPGSPGSFANKGAGTCRSDPIPTLAACSLAEGADCNYLTGAAAPGSRSKCVTKPSVCGSVGGGKCCVCNDGFGLNCNDRCYKGQCVSDLYVGCPGGQYSTCISAGDRACAAGTTCCGSNKGSPCTSDSNCTASPQGSCLDVNPLDADATKYCYYQQCVNLSTDPQHCGACSNDCGEYTLSAASCTDNMSCGTCFNDGDCAGVGGKCVDGTCGRCRGDTSATGQPACGVACSSDAQCSGGKCTNRFCCAAGLECVGGATGSCLPMVCHRLTNRGTCAGGVCAAGAACVGPDAGDLALAGQPGMCSLDFEFTSEPAGTSTCRAYATNYRTDGGTALARIDESGAITAYTPNPADSTRLNGVAVSRDGSNLFSAMVNDGTGIPGLALRPPGAATYSRVKTALATGGLDDAPFDQVEFNTGPVGPAFDYATFTGITSRKMWLGNFKCPASPVDGICTCVDLDLCRVDFSAGSWSATPEPYCNQPCADPDGRCEYSTSCAIGGSSQRISTIAFEQVMYLPANVFHRYVMVSHGTTLSFVDLGGGTPRQRDVNLASPAVCTPDPARGESTIEAILSVAAVPYGDVILEVRGAGDQPAPGNVKDTWLINVNAHDRSCRHELVVQRSIKHVNPCAVGNSCPGGQTCVEQVCMKNCGSCPSGFTCSGGVCRIIGEVPRNFGIGAGSNGGNGRLAVMPSGKLLRWVAAVGTAPTGLSEYDTTPGAPSGQVNCDDGNPCTVDFYDSALGQCGHLPVDCDDRDLCTSDGCAPLTGQCLHAPLNCDDTFACTADSCDPATGACLHALIAVTEPGPAQFASSTSIQWPPTADASHWNTYRGTIPSTMLGSRPPGAVYDQVCHESADALGDGPTTSTDAATPSLGSALYYLVSAEAGGCESALGHASSGASIPNTSPCPTPP